MRLRPKGEGGDEMRRKGGRSDDDRGRLAGRWKEGGLLFSRRRNLVGLSVCPSVCLSVGR